MSDSNRVPALPRVVDALKLVSASASVQGECALNQMTRLDLDRSREMGSVKVSLQFSRRMDGTRVADGRIQASLPRNCQRCLSIMMEDVDCKPVWALAENDAEEAELDAHYEAILRVDDPLNLWEAVEDELLLASALTPTHANPSDCDPAFTGLQSTVKDDVGVTTVKPHPFAVLCRLKQDSV